MIDRNIVPAPVSRGVRGHVRPGGRGLVAEISYVRRVYVSSTSVLTCFISRYIGSDETFPAPNDLASPSPSRGSPTPICRLLRTITAIMGFFSCGKGSSDAAAKPENVKKVRDNKGVPSRLDPYLSLLVLHLTHNTPPQKTTLRYISTLSYTRAGYKTHPCPETHTLTASRCTSRAQRPGMSRTRAMQRAVARTCDYRPPRPSCRPSTSTAIYILYTSDNTTWYLYPNYTLAGSL